MKYDKTIIHVDTTANTANVTFNGQSRLYSLKAIKPTQLIDMYKKRGFKYSWLNSHTALLTKTTARQAEVKAA